LKGETGPQSTIKGCREVFFVTDRQSVGTAAFGDGPSDKEEISYGRAVVSIPLRHQLGEVERPWRVWVIELPEKADRHVMIASREPLEAGLFHAAVEKAIDRSPVKSTFVFIHGYNVSFDEAVLRTGQLAWDLKFRGPAVSYCWPSRGDVEGYLSDIEMAEWTVPHLKRFLRDLRERTKARRVHLVAHSMGGRVLTRALQQLSVSAESINTRFQEVVLAAPDLNAKILSQLAGAMQEASDRVTIYSSGRDLALQISAILRGESSRAGGKSPSSLKLPASFDVIDATKVRDSLLGHSYFVTSPLLLNDLALLIIQGLGPDDRAVYLERSGPVWVFR
jgi:esterase/lipase superfamily enzyme